MEYLEVQKYLIEQSEENYKSFNLKLIPGVSNILGVRLPILRNLAKEISKNNYNSFIKENKNIYYEETLLQGLIIGYIQDDLTNIIPLVKDFIPKIDNWATCDSFCNNLKIVLKNKDFFWDFIQPYFRSDSTYEVRFAVVLTLNYFIELDYIYKFFSIVKNDITNTDYYVDMAIAWAISYYFMEFKIETMKLLKSMTLSKSVQNKTIQKISDSRKVTLQDKELVKLYRK